LIYPGQVGISPGRRQKSGCPAHVRFAWVRTRVGPMVVPCSSLSCSALERGTIYFFLRIPAIMITQFGLT
jgi:hypothetical protein